jgi:MFS family permease
MNELKKMTAIGFIALLLVNFASLTNLALLPAANLLYSHFLGQGVPIGVLNFMLTGSLIFVQISALSSPLLMRNFSKKSIIIFMFTVYTVVSISPFFIMNAYYIVFSRVIVGLAIGALTPVAIALIIEIYRDDSKRKASYIGFFNGSRGLIGVVITIGASFLMGTGLAKGPVEGIQAVFSVNFAAIPILILLIITLPKTPAGKKIVYEQSDPGSKAIEDVTFPVAKAVAIVFSCLMVSLLGNIINYQYAIYLAENFTIDPAMYGPIGATIAASSIFAGLLFGTIIGRTKRFTITIAYAMLTLGYAGLRFPIGIPWVLAGLAVNGFAFGLALPYFYSYASALFPARYTSLFVSLITVAVAIGGFLCTFSTTFLQSILNLSTVTAILPYISGIAGIAAVLSIILGIRSVRSESKS